MFSQRKDGVVSIKYPDKISLLFVDNCLNDAYRINESRAVDDCLYPWDLLYPIKNILVVKISADIMGTVYLPLILAHLLFARYVILSSSRGMNTKQIGLVFANIFEDRASAVARKRG